MPIATDVPVIDLAGLEGSAAAHAALDQACRAFGFFHVTGHGVDPAVTAALQGAMHGFFHADRAVRAAVERTDRNCWGWFDRELTKNRRDRKEIFDVGPPDADGPMAGAAPQWPAAPAGFRAAVDGFAAAATTLSRRLLAALARNLGSDPAVLLDGFGADHTSFVRLNWYPPTDDPAPPDTPLLPASGTFGIHHHTDAGALTVLWQDRQPGLQVLHDGRWLLIPPRPGALVINVGDIVQVWSNDRYRAPLHRVLASTAVERFSAAWFFNPAYATTYAPLPGVLAGGDPPHYRPIGWGEFRARRSAGDFADYGAEVQISDWRTVS